MNTFELVHAYMSGAITLASWLITFFFLRFRKSTRDPLFGYFAAAFFLLGLEHIVVEFWTNPSSVPLYVLRLLAFLLIIIGIWNKNRRAKAP
jgi:hypothetical protein